MPHQDPLELVVSRFRQLMLLTGGTGLVKLACGTLKLTKYRVNESFDVGIPCVISGAVAILTAVWYMIVVYKSGKGIAWPIRIHFQAAKVLMLFYVVIIGLVIYNITAQDASKQQSIEEQVINDAQTIKILFIAATVFNVVLLIASMRTIFLYGHHLGVVMSPGLLCRDNPGVRSVVVDLPSNSNGSNGRSVVVCTPNSTPSLALKSHEIQRETMALKSAQANYDYVASSSPPAFQKTDEEDL